MASDPNEEMSLGPRTVRVAVVQAAPVLFDVLKSIRKLADLTADAAKSGAGLVVFPEAFIAGYPKGHDFGVSVGLRSPEGRDEFRRLFENALDVPGEATEAIGKVARDHAIHLVVGVVERDGGTLYCTALIFGPAGTLLGKHRKLMPTAMERVIWGSGDGSTLPVIATSLGKIGTVICWENYMPLLRTAMYAKGIERVRPLINVSLFSGRETASLGPHVSGFIRGCSPQIWLPSRFRSHQSEAAPD